MDPLWSLPTTLCIKRREPSTTGEYVICSLKYIPALTRFGPYGGKLVNRSEGYQRRDSLSQVKESSLSDTVDVIQPSWLRYVKCISKREEGNLIAVETTSGFYYVASKAIPANKELKVWYPNTIHPEKEGYPTTALQNLQVNTCKDFLYYAIDYIDINTCTSDQNRHSRSLHSKYIEFPEDTIAMNCLQFEDDQSISSGKRTFYSKHRPTSIKVKKSTRMRNGCGQSSPNNEGRDHSETIFQSNRNTAERTVTNAYQKNNDSPRKEVDHSRSLPEENLNPNLIRKIELATQSRLSRNLKNLWSMKEMHANRVTRKKKKETSNERNESDKTTLESHTGMDACNVNIPGNTPPESLQRNKRIHAGEDLYSYKRCLKGVSANGKLKNHSKVQTASKQYEWQMQARTLPINSKLKKQKVMHVKESDYKSTTGREGNNKWNNLKFYVRVHTGEKPYESKEYGVAFTPTPNAQSHTLIDTAEKPYRCNVYRKEFIDKKTLIRHEIAQTGEKGSDCETFSRKFSQIGEIKPHNVTQFCKRPLKGNVHRKLLKRERTLISHKKVHTGEKSYERRKLSIKSNLKQHNMIHTEEKPYGCNSCPRKFSQRSQLKTHCLIHTRERPFKCVVCRKTFSCNTNLIVHERIHSGEKPYECNTCSRMFSQSGDLKRHNMKHTGEKPYECRTCSRKFSRKYDLKRHNVVHTGEKPYECKTCGRKFSRICHLKSHCLVHTGKKPFKCNVCGKTFAQKSVAMSHERRHRGERSYE